MSDELFPVESVAMDSPRLLWMKKHQVLTYRLPSTGEWLAGFAHGRNYAKIVASTDAKSRWFCDETSHNGDSQIGIAYTEDEAIAELLTTHFARWNNIRLWNEEAQ